MLSISELYVSKDLKKRSRKRHKTLQRLFKTAKTNIVRLFYIDDYRKTDDKKEINDNIVNSLYKEYNPKDFDANKKINEIMIQRILKDSVNQLNK